MIKSWSFSRLQDYQSCPQKSYLKYVEKIPDPRPSPAADRGTAIHQLAEDYVRGKLKKVPQELSKFQTEFETLAQQFKQGFVSLEGEWGFDRDWQPCDYATAWGRIKADAVMQLSPEHYVVIDYKTGKKFGNEIKHKEQLNLYALAVAIRNPDVQELTTENWYLDQKDGENLTSTDCTRQQAMMKYLKYFDRQAQEMTTATKFPTKANKFSCQWCPYSPRGTGDCKDGV